jgi:hypothetical protein
MDLYFLVDPVCQPTLLLPTPLPACSTTRKRARALRTAHCAPGRRALALGGRQRGEGRGEAVLVLLLRSCSPGSASAAPELAIRMTALDRGSTIRGIPRVAARRLAALRLRAPSRAGAAAALADATSSPH